MRITSPVTIGRQEEISLLERSLTQLRQNTGRTVFLIGEPGIGKSRLVDHCLRQAADRGMPVLRGRGSMTGGGTPFRPILEALSSHFRTTAPPTDAELLPYRSALARVIPEWRSTAAQARTESVVELAEALLRLLAVIGRGTGCVLALEDLHWADSESVAVAEYLADNLAQLPVLLLATVRTDPGNALTLARSAERRRVATVATLPPLNAPEVRALVAGCLDAPAHDVPDAVVDRLVARSDGNPYLVEELLADLVDSELLTTATDGWQVTGDLDTTVPTTVVQSFGHRLLQVDAPLRDFLLLAATIGPRCCVSALRTVTGLDDPTLFAHLRAATEAHFLVPDDSSPHDYAFRHAITVDAVLAGIPAAQRAALARRAADALREDGPPTPDRCQLVADLLVTADDRPGAALLLAEAGRLTMADGASASAVLLLERAESLAGPAHRAEITESLAHALAEDGQLDRAFALAGTLPTLGSTTLSADRMVALHTRLAWAAVVAERSAETVAQVAAARSRLHDGGAPEQAAALAVVEAHLALLPGEEERLPDAERLAEEAADMAERAGLPVLACQAWQVLAMLSRTRGFDVADGCLERMLAVAETHGLPGWRFEALIRLGGNAFMRTGEARRLEQARAAAEDLGSIVLSQRTEGFLAMHAVLSGDPATAEEIIGRCLDAAGRMRNHATHRYLLLTSATLAAHQGRRRTMEHVLRAFRRAGGEGSLLTPVMLGLCRAMCALLEEDRATADAEFAAAAAWEAEHPNVYFLAGRYGLRPLLAVLAGTAGWAEHAVVAASPGAELAWNRQFLDLAEAVLLGREGRAAEATEAVARVRRDPGRFPTGHHLGLRLVAEAALADGWGDPVAWLRAAEEYFHALDVPPVAGACRALLRQAGANVAQRRRGRELIPAGLRAQGVTPREYEVLALLVDRPGNQDLARLLSISPRTVEKHLASLIQKTGRPDRAALCRLAADLALPG
ncbi:AAA family ATPase [Streptomyces sp. SP17BM10]|uniref:helix-turn-helix transcriptional regulator n=1 Tax=Streptomyces sp. SP17BM10 TaxID=3002530 RepID=UPI002E75A431|nr:AAA family ATPase [Streptomyces sp. SP17BM10]MEE1788782.1 AAA family ATPase [Streptomyces sp. SP17BM10]